MAKNVDRYEKYAKNKKRQDRLRRWGLDVEEKDNGMQVPHSAAYHDYFEGYAETKIPGKNGRGYRVERVYVGHYYTLPGGRRSKAMHMAIHCALFLLAAAAVIIGAAQPGGANGVWYVVIPTFGVIMSMVFLATGLASYITAPEKMTVGEYKAGATRIVRWSQIGMVAALVAALGSLIHMFACPADAPGASAGTCAFCAAGTLCLFAINYFERHTEYEVLENQTEKGENAVMIE